MATAQHARMHANVTAAHKTLHEFVGNWNVSQKLWAEPNAQPTMRKGTSTCSIVADGMATLMVTEIEDTKGVALMTYSPKNDRYDLAWVDTFGDAGLLMMNGNGYRVASHQALQNEFGKSAQQQREWGTGLVSPSQCLPESVMENVTRFAASSGARSFARTANAPAAAPEIPMRLVEHKISDNQWVLEFFLPGPGGKEYLAQQNNFTRA